MGAELADPTRHDAGELARRWLWGSVGLALVLQIAVIHVRLLNVAFGTVPLNFRDWLTCAAIASAVLWFGELRKLIARALRGEQAMESVHAAGRDLEP